MYQVLRFVLFFGHFIFGFAKISEVDSFPFGYVQPASSTVTCGGFERRRRVKSSVTEGRIAVLCISWRELFPCLNPERGSCILPLQANLVIGDIGLYK